MIPTNERKQFIDNMQGFIENLPHVLYSTSPFDSETYYITPNISDFCGYSAEEVLLRPLLRNILVHPDDRHLLAAALDDCMCAARPFSCNYRIICRDGTVKHVRDAGRPATDIAGRVVRIDGIITDITEHIAVQQSLKRSLRRLADANTRLKEKDRLKNQFVSTVSHELRTPLTVFRNIVSNALCGVMGKITPRMRRNLETAESEIGRLSRIISDLLDLSRIEAGRMKLSPKPVDISRLLRDAADSLKPLAAEKKTTLVTVLPVTPIVTLADRDRIAQVLTNLIGNALKFVPSDNGRIDVMATHRGNEVLFDVIDNGPGIPPQDLDRIFGRFTQVEKPGNPRKHGTGLGLAISQEIVQLHGGRIWAENSATGARLRFTLPVRA